MTQLRTTTKPHQTGKEPIAIIGIGCRFPGGVDSPESFWRLLRDGVDAITDIPSDRFDVEAYYDARPTTPGKVISRWGGFLRDLDKFDAYFFGISPREADRLDPQQRLLLEVSWEALEDAGQPVEKLAGSTTGVFVGMWINDFEDRLFQNAQDLDFYKTTGSGRYTASGRLSYFLGLNGPSLTLDTACSSSLVATHLACKSLWSGECQLALAGGANTIWRPHISIAYSQSQMLSSDGRCKFGDARANGYVRSEGAAIIVLKPLSRALADNDPIYALIAGSAVNNDGRSSGSFGTPGIAGQEDMLRKAYQDAGVSPGKIHYVEAHGTGTNAGDPVELQALGNVLQQDRPADRPCIVGSVKTNIGHTEGAAGAAGLIKVALALKHKMIPATLHFQNPNPKIPWEKLPLVIKPALSTWPVQNVPALAGVSSFGISGTNAHVVLQESVNSNPSSVISGKNTAEHWSLNTDHYSLLPISAQTPEALEALARSYQNLLKSDEQNSLQDICFSASLRRSHHDHRLAIAAQTREDLIENLEAFLQGESRLGVVSGRKESDEKRKIVFVFPGQGSQWLGMARQLLKREPAFRASMEQCDAALRRYVEWSLLEQLALDETSSTYKLNQIDVIQPTLFGIQVSLAALWRAWGIEPDAVVGHSMGEVGAAHVAGALTLSDAASIICRRSRLLRRTSGKGAMAVVELAIDEARKALAGYEDKLSIAVSNSSRSTVLSGDPAALDEIIAKLEKDEVFCRRIKVDVASHSPQMDPLRDDLLAAIKGLQPSESAVPIYSTVKGEVVDGAQLDEKYWVNNLRQPVLFSKMVRQLREDGHDIFIEISAHPLLLPSIQQELQLLEKSVTTLASMRREEDEQLVMLESLGTLYTQGYPFDWRRLHPHGGKFVRLPNYPWQRERFWLDERKAKSEGRGAKSERRSSSSHPLLGAHFQSASDGTHFWEIELNADDLTYLEDHRVNGMIVVPAAAYAEMALAAMKEIFGDDRHVLEKLEFTEALFVSKDPAQEVQLVLSVEMTGVASFQILSRKAGNKDQSAAWTLHAKGTMRVAQLASNGAAHEQNEIEKHPPSDAAVTSGAEHYQAMSKRGLQYGPSFQGVAEHWQKNGELVSRLQIHEAIASDAGAYQVHPALLDACFQLVVASLPGEDGEVQARATYLPVSLESLQLHERPNLANGLWARVLKKSNGAIDAATISGEVLLLDESGRILLEACGLTLQRVERDRTQELNDWFYRVEWHAKKREPSSQSSKISRWLIFADQRGAGEQLVTALKARGETCIVVTHGNAYNQRSEERFEINPSRSEDFTRLTAEVFKDAPSSHYGVIHLWSLDGISTPQSALTAVESAQELGCGSVLLLMQAFVQANLSERTRLWLLTGGVQVIAEAPANWSVAQAPLWGLGAVLANEHPECKCTRIDLSVMPDAVEIRALSEELLSPVHEDQIALCGDRRFVARLKKWTPEENEENASHSSEAEKKIPAQPEQAYHLEIAKPGILDNLTLRATTRRAAAPGEVEIQVKAAGLNFLDVMKAMGVCPGFDPAVPPALGGECAGIITAVGDGVKGFQIGDEVVAITPSFKDTSMFSAYVTVPALLVLHKPAPLSFDEAATYPIAFLTAFYALHHLGRMSEGERVLIHSATGGVGLAAIQLAQHAGAEIFATAGSPEKRAWLKSLGVQHVFDSRSLSFADEIMRVTSGESEERKAKSEERGAKKEDRSTLHALRSTEPGVDLVLNSLTGAAINKNLEILKPYGRFLEIGKRDIYENSRVGLEPFRKNLSYFAIDLARAIEERPKLISSLFREITQRFAEGVFKPLAYKAYPISNAVSAFRDMAQAKHIGKIVLTMQEKEVLVAPTVETRKVFRADGNYLITGGLGGLGLTFAQWMVEQGARHLVLAGRSGASDEAKGAIEAMEKAGAKITVAKADVAKPEQVANVLAQIKKSMLPLKGIIHAAGILADGTLAQIDRERFYAAMPPKIDGAWNLHLQTLDEPLDFFILFSSVASVLGTTGQGNYAAGNAFLDALAQHRRAAGRPAMSINWGPWSKVGLAAAQANRGERLESRGLGSISPEQGLQAFDLILRSSPAEAVVMPFNFAQWREYHPAARHASLFAEFAIEQKSEEAPASTARAKRATIKEQVLALDSGRQRRAVLETHLQEQAAQVLKLAPSRIPLAKPLKSIGLDSLMALELRNRFEASLGLTLPATMIFNYPTITALASHLAGKLEISLEDVEKLKPVSKLSVGGNGDELDHVLEEIEQLSEDEARKILTE